MGSMEIKAPNDIYYNHQLINTKVFLAGSIEMGKAELWQDKIVNAFRGKRVTFLNPRRDDWDSSWKQDKSNPQFREQVEWELNALEASDIIIIYFDPATKSPITLLELGLHAATNPEKLIVCCPEGFWRKGNVDIVCEKYNITQVDSLHDLIYVLGDNL